ncbi:histidine phosphatase family protein [Halobacillus sp. Marseille-Q1614]|uniref:histidine phosphatase family protein n=1 Tax=Halobacillus sp. Marseille-Q1614 TaxID=2709134 RepID=UPI0015708085|nr:histidine phosphatase family protein [Halobacillus sp. Marseille-Q1614]
MGTLDSVHIYFVRHGMTKWNKEKRYLGHTDQQLMTDKPTDLFPLKQYLSEISIDRIFTSDLCRCLETSAYLLPDQQACAEPRLREMDFGDWEGKTHHELQNDPSYKCWINQWQTSAPPNGEHYQSFRSRVRSALDELLETNERKNVLMVTHGGVIREIMNRYIQGLSFKDTKITHGQGARLIFNQDGGDWRCSSWSVVPMLGKENG